MDRQIITLKEACKYLGISPSHMYKLTSRKIIRHFKPNGKMIYFYTEDLKKYIETCEVISNVQVENIVNNKYNK